MNSPDIALLSCPLYSGLLIIKGTGSKEMLQGQLTCDLNSLSNAEHCMGAHCNRQGKVISLFRLSVQNGDWLLNMPCELVPVAKQALQKYAAFYRGVTLENPGTPLTNCTAPLETLNRRIPALRPETSEKYFAHELGLEELGAISFNKGCYTGQEIIARMHYRGKPKTELILTEVSSPIPPVRGTDIFDERGQVSGSLVDCAAENAGHWRLLITAPIHTQNTLFMDADLTLPLKKTDSDNRSHHVG